MAPPCAAAGAVTVRAASPAAASSETRFKTLRAIIPHLVTVALGPPNDLDVAGARLRRDANDRPAGSNPPHRAARRGRPSCRRGRITRGPVKAVSQVIEANGLDHRIVLLLTGFPEYQAQRADLLPESKLLSIRRCDFESRRLGHDRLAVGARRVLIESDYADVLQQHVRQLPVVGALGLPSNQNVDGVAGLDEAGNAGNVVDADRGRSHAVWQKVGDRRALSFTGELRGEDRLVHCNRPKNDPL